MIKIIDDKGKVFGIINIIDLTVILFLISTTAGFAWLIYTGELFKDHNPAKKLFVEKDVDVLLIAQPNSTIQILRDARNNQINSEERITLINVTSIKKSVKRTGAIDILNNNLFDIIISVRVKSYFDRRQNVYYYKGTPLKPTENLSLEIIDTFNNTITYAPTITKV